MSAEEKYIPIKRISYEILTEYKKLAKLEKKELTHSDSYKATLSRIKTLTQLEDALYFDISFESSEFISNIASEALLEINNDKPVSFFHSDSSILFCDLSDEELVASRIIRKLLSLHIRVDSSRTQYNLVNITEYLTESKYTLYFNILDDELNNPDYIKSKYDIAFVLSYKNKIKPPKCDLDSKVLNDDITYVAECFYKISLLDSQSIKLESNQKKLFFITTYLRTILLGLGIDYAYFIYEQMIKNMKENGIEPNDGINIIEDLILNLDEDKKKYLDGNYELKRNY